MTDADFLEAILAQPEEDTPRLMYADWLEEKGEGDRAEFIRLQIESARLPEGDPRGCDLDSKAEGILAEFENKWLGEWSERYAAGKDPGFFVLDEVIGYLVTLLWTRGPSPLALAAAFFVFRFFDVVKPPPARRCERIGATGTDPVVLLVATAREGAVSVNLMAPLLVHPDTGAAVQAVLEGQGLDLRRTLVPA